MKNKRRKEKGRIGNDLSVDRQIEPCEKKIIISLGK